MGYCVHNVQLSHIDVIWVLSFLVLSSLQCMKEKKKVVSKPYLTCRKLPDFFAPYTCCHCHYWFSLFSHPLLTKNYWVTSKNFRSLAIRTFPSFIHSLLTTSHPLHHSLIFSYSSRKWEELMSWCSLSNQANLLKNLWVSSSTNITLK